VIAVANNDRTNTRMMIPAANEIAMPARPGHTHLHLRERT
jgi:hypothetical protein